MGGNDPALDDHNNLGRREPATCRRDDGIGPAVGERLAARVAAAATAPEGPPQALTDRGIDALSADQAAALVQVCSSGRAVQVLVGPAGSGKTTTLKAIKAVWNMNSVDATATDGVVGLAPSAVAAAELSTALRSRCETTAKWLHETVGPAGQQRAQLIANLNRRLAETPSSGESIVPLQQAKYRLQSEQKRWQLKPGQLLIVDEATLAGTLDLDHLTQQAAAVGAGVLLGRRSPSAHCGAGWRRIRTAGTANSNRRANRTVALQGTVGSRDDQGFATW